MTRWPAAAAVASVAVAGSVVVQPMLDASTAVLEPPFCWKASPKPPHRWSSRSSNRGAPRLPRSSQLGLPRTVLSLGRRSGWRCGRSRGSGCVWPLQQRLLLRQPRQLDLPVSVSISAVHSYQVTRLSQNRAGAPELHSGLRGFHEGWWASSFATAYLHFVVSFGLAAEASHARSWPIPFRAT